MLRTKPMMQYFRGSSFLTRPRNAASNPTGTRIMMQSAPSAPNGFPHPDPKAIVATSMTISAANAPMLTFPNTARMLSPAKRKEPDSKHQTLNKYQASSSKQRLIPITSPRTASRPLFRTRGGDNLEVRPLQFPEFVQPLDSLIGRNRQPPVAAIVGHEHAVLLQSLENCLNMF